MNVMMWGESSKACAAMVLTQLVSGGMAVLSKAVMSTGNNPYIFVFYRQAFATLSLAPFALFLDRGKSAPLSRSLLCQIFLVSLCGITLNLNLFYLALNYTTATFAAASNNAIPAMTFVLALLFGFESICIKQRHGLAKIVGSVVCVSGALVFALVKGPSLLRPPPANHERSPSPTTTHLMRKGDWIKGSLIMLSAHLTCALWLIFQGPLVKQYPAKLRLTALQCFFSWVQSGLWAVAVERRPSSWKLGWDVRLFSLVYCGVISAGISNWLKVWVIEKKGAVFTAMFTPLSFVIAAIFSAFLWNEAFHWGSVGGVILLVIGLYGFLWGTHKEGKTSKKDEQLIMTSESKDDEEEEEEEEEGGGGGVDCVIHK